MAKKTNTKRALMMSLISLMICFTMLIGTTFAWFTDTAVSSGNIIKSGTLDVEMYWAEGNEAVPTDDSSWKDASSVAIFTYDKWEPGYVQARHIKIANKGNLALKYMLKIVPNGTASKLADVIDVYFVDPAAQATRDEIAGATPVGTLAELIADPDGAAYGSLAAADAAESSETVTIALKMQESAGNEYQNLSIGTDFSVVLLATQDTVENDSFGTDYDAAATYGLVASGTAKDDDNDGIYKADIVNDDGGKVGSASIPGEALKNPDQDPVVLVVETARDTNVTVNSDQGAKSYDISVSGLKEDNTEPVEIQFRVGFGLTGVKLYHKGNLMDAGDYSYDSNTGLIKFKSATFSPFTVVYDSVAKPAVKPDGINELPKATVTQLNYEEFSNIEWGNYGQWSPTDGLDSQLEAAYKFECPVVDDPAAKQPYDDWYCDFYVKLDRDLGENEIFLGGNYGSFGWVGFHNGDLTLEANTELPLLGSVVSNGWTYEAIRENVGTFICGVGDVDDALKGATFTVMLRLTNPKDENEFYNVSTINYTFQ